LETANNKPPVTVEKIVEKIVDRPVEKIVEKIVEKPTEDLTKINLLNTELSSLKALLVTANNKPPVTVEKIVEKIVEKPTEDLTKINLLNSEIVSLKAALETANNKPPVVVEKIIEKIVEVKAPTDYKMFAGIYGKKIVADDLKLVEGIGPKIEELFHNAGLKTWASVAASKPERLKEILVAAGERFQMHNPTTWPKQCQMMVDNKWDELKKYQDLLDGGVEP
jgi:predicted flap endonuclease-1-like 5' DNA nuclease